MNIDRLIADVLKLTATTNTGRGFKGLMLGVVYSLRQAADLGFASRTGSCVGPDYSAELDETGAALVGHKQVPNHWLAGFFFNSALIRIAAGSHRALRTLYRTNTGRFAELADRAVRENKVEERDIDWLRKVYHDVNAFKHEGHAELLEGRQVETIEHGVKAAGQLVRLIQLAI